MISNESLGNRLNDFKNQTQIPNPNPQPISKIHNLLTSVLIPIFSGITISIKTLVFGYSAKLIFKTDWNFLGIICIGLLVHFLMTYIYDLVHGELE